MCSQSLVNRKWQRGNFSQDIFPCIDFLNLGLFTCGLFSLIYIYTGNLCAFEESVYSICILPVCNLSPIVVLCK